MNIKDKTILITGASRGLGRALALRLSAGGAKVVLVAHPSQELNELEKEIQNRGDTAFALSADVSDKNAIYPLVAQAVELAGPIDVLINNASTLGPVPLKLLIDTNCEDLEKATQTNLIGPMRLTKAVLGSMLLRRTGVVINISSDAAVNAYPTWGAYSVTKAALDHLTRIWAQELVGSPVRFFSVDPGEMDTKMHADAIPDADRTKLLKPDEVAQKITTVISQSESHASGSRIIL